MTDFTGTIGDDTLTGTDQPDRLDALAGNDRLDGRGGADVMLGGPGDDVFFVDNPGDQVNELINEGNDTVYTSVSYGLAAGSYVELLAVDGIGTTYAINLNGNALSNTIWGNYGANIFHGFGGGDAFVGFGGDDVYFVTDPGDRVLEDAGGGNDIVYASFSYGLTPGASIELLSADGIANTYAINLNGNELSQTIWGNNGANIFHGFGGGDAFVGFGGDDVYFVTDPADRVLEDQNGGNDTVYASFSYGLTAGASIELLSADGIGNTYAINLNGNALSQTIWGNNGVNIIHGGGGGDAMLGFGGGDTYFVDDAGDRVLEDLNGGNDTVYASVSYTLTAGSYVELLSTDGIGNTNAINLTGNELGNTIWGNNGANILNGGGGADAMFGFGGDDTYVVDNGADVVIEAAGKGFDVVSTTVSYVLAAGSEVELLKVFDPNATGAINLTGNELTRELRGSAGNNVLTGHADGVSFYGGLGADTLDSSGFVNNRYYFETALGNGNIDTILGFNPVFDTVQLGGAPGQPFEAMASGMLRPGSLRIGSAAVDADDYIIYNSATGALLYDDDGNGAHAAVQFATLAANLNLNIANIVTTGPANHAPVISSGATATTPENGPVGTIVYQAAATDSDGDRITYSLIGDSALTIDPLTGTVQLNVSADFETKSSYVFWVIAADSGDTALKEVVLTITDVAETITTTSIDETTGNNDSTSSAQMIDRTILNVSVNSDLPNQALPSATIHGSVSTNNDIDYYKIELHAGELIVLDVDHTTGSLDSFLRLFTPNGAEIVNNDDKISGDPGSNPPFDHNTDSYLTYRVAETGIYIFSIESFGDLNDDQEDDGPNVGESSGNYSLNVSIGPPATAAQIMDEDIDALISGSQWGTTALSYGFPTLPSQYPANMTEPSNNFTPFSAQQQAVASLQLGLIAQVSQLTFTQNTSSPGDTHIRYAMSDEADVAYAYYPGSGTGGIGGTAWFNHEAFNDPVKGNYAWMGILHETGHTLGLKHGHEAPAVSANHDSVEYTVMTYRSYPGDDLTGYQNEQWGYPQSLMMLDIAALQRIYGANFTTNSGNSVYSWSRTTGEMSINGVGQGGPGGPDPVLSANRVFLTIWDGGGNDTYDLSSYTTGVSIDLRPGEWSTLSSAQLASLAPGGAHMARGNVANALMYQGNTASLIENAIGGSSADNFIGNQVANHFTGNGGADTFRWMAATDIGTGALADTIMDFARGADKIDLSNIDANSTTTTVQDLFHFIGTAAFSNTAGELRYDVTGGNAHIFGDRDGNGVADMEIVVNNVTVLAGSDFQGVTGSDAVVPADLDGNAAADLEAVADRGDAIYVTRATFGHDNFGPGPGTDGPAHMAIHHLVALAGPEFYF